MQTYKPLNLKIKECHGFQSKLVFTEHESLDQILSG